MHYCISDIHGCYREYMALLKEINFSDEDHLYILGDVVDRGPEPMKVLQDMLNRQNVTFIMGNHDYVFSSLEQFAQIAGEARRGMIARRKESERRRGSATSGEERHRGKFGFPEGIQAALRSGVSNRRFETPARRSGKPPLFCYLRKLL